MPGHASLRLASPYAIASWIHASKLAVGSEFARTRTKSPMRGTFPKPETGVTLMTGAVRDRPLLQHRGARAGEAGEHVLLEGVVALERADVEAHRRRLRLELPLGDERRLLARLLRRLLDLGGGVEETEEAEVAGARDLLVETGDAADAQLGAVRLGLLRGPLQLHPLFGLVLVLVAGAVDLERHVRDVLADRVEVDLELHRRLRGGLGIRE